MNREERLLPIYAAHKLSAAEWEDLKAVAISLSKDYSIKPVRGVQGSPGFILALGEAPDFVCEGVALVPNTKSVGLRTAMNSVLEHVQDGRILSVAEQLGKMIGGKVTELEPVFMEPKVKFQ